MTDFLRDISGPLSHQLFTIGGKPVTVGGLLSLLIAVVLLVWLSRWLRSWLLNRVLTRTHLDPGMRQTVATLAGWTVLILGFILIVQSVGINLSALSVLAGAVGVGVGFGLQNIFSNFISGLIVMMERPVRIGDRVEVGGVAGDVIAIGARSTTLLTASRSRIFVPNQSFITGNVINWQVGDVLTALLIPVKLAAGGDPNAVSPLLRDAVKAIQEGGPLLPPPRVDFLSFDATGCVLQVTVWVNGNAEQRANHLTEINLTIYKVLTAHEIKLA
jgi:small-conductance mechanosensitive channel